MAFPQTFGSVIEPPQGQITCVAFPRTFGTPGVAPPQGHAPLFLRPCPCRCNETLAYKFNHERRPPQTPVEWASWYDCQFSYEEPNLSRYRFGVKYTIHEMLKRLDEVEELARYNLVMRCLPHLKKKTTRLFVASMASELWDLWIRKMTANTPGVRNSHKVRPYSHLDEKHEVICDSISWSGVLPEMGKPFWWFKKWVNRRIGSVFRARILSLTLTHNPFNKYICAKMTYETERWDGSQWRSI